MFSVSLQNIDFLSYWNRKSACLYSKVVASPLLKSSLCFYSPVSSILLIKSFSLALKTSKIHGHLLLENSKDPLVFRCAPKLQTGTWKVRDAVLYCENDMEINQACGNGHHNRHKLGYTSTPRVHKRRSSKYYWRYIPGYHKLINETHAVS